MKRKLLVFLIFVKVSVSLNAQQIVNGDMEVWQDHALFSNPVSFFTFDNIVFIGNQTTEKTTDSHSGQFAALIQTGQTQSSTNMRGMLGYGTFTTTTSQNYFYGYAFNQRPTRFKFWYKFEPAGPDTAFAGIILTKWTGKNTVIGSAILNITAASNGYVLMDVPITYSSPAIPDTIVISFMNSLNQFPTLGTKFYIDDITIDGVTGIEDKLNQNGVSIYPNPFLDKFVIETPVETEIRILTVFGIEILNQKIPTGKTIIHTNTYSSGIYFMVFSDSKKTTSCKLVKP